MVAVPVVVSVTAVEEPLIITVTMEPSVVSVAMEESSVIVVAVLPRPVIVRVLRPIPPEVVSAIVMTVIAIGASSGRRERHKSDGCHRTSNGNFGSMPIDCLHWFNPFLQ